jgi:hypothetical protein
MDCEIILPAATEEALKPITICPLRTPDVEALERAERKSMMRFEMRARQTVPSIKKKVRK